MKQLLSSWSIRRSPGWVDHVNAPQTEAELTSLRRRVSRGCPFGDAPTREYDAIRCSLKRFRRLKASLRIACKS
jgi:hypothetical protein